MPFESENVGFARHAVQGEGQLTLQAALGRLSLAFVTVYWTLSLSLFFIGFY